MKECYLVEKRKKAAGFTQIFLKDESSFKFVPGQFFTLSRPGQKQTKSLPATSPPDKYLIEFLLPKNTPSWLYNLKGEDGVFLEGPFGNGWPFLQMEKKNLLLMAEEEEMAGFASLIEYIVQKRKRFKKVTLIYKSSNPDLIFFKERFRRWQQHMTIYQISPSTKTKVGQWPRSFSLLLDQLQPNPENYLIFLAGNPLFYKKIILDFFSYGFDIQDISIYDFSFKDDGPVFQYGEKYSPPKIIKIV